jgi:hypothetical protein
VGDAWAVVRIQYDRRVVAAASAYCCSATADSAVVTCRDTVIIFYLYLLLHRITNTPLAVAVDVKHFVFTYLIL